MTIRYSTSTIPGKLRTVHTIVIEHEKLETTKAREILIWAKSRIFDRYVWKELKEAVRLGIPFTVEGSGIFE